MSYRTQYYFNPDHDLALANGDPNFASPRLASTFQRDAAYLPLWFAQSGSAVLIEEPNSQWFDGIQSLFPRLKGIQLVSFSDLLVVQQILPWGWNRAVCKFFNQHGVTPDVLPGSQELDDIRQLSHRRTAIEAMNFLGSDPLLCSFMPEPAQELRAADVDAFAAKFEQTVFKAPWSGSGQGLFWINRSFTENARGWCRRVIGKQGSIIGEQVYDRYLDFAMEFSCSNGSIAFEGYSLFTTEKQGIYRCNALLSDEEIFRQLAGYIPHEILSRVKEQLFVFLEEKIASFYAGYLGVDMFIYNACGAFLLHPCVEINLRTTMGIVARRFFDNFVSSEKSGVFFVDYNPQPGTLFADHQSREIAMPLQVIDGRIKSGYLSLSPVTPKSLYRVRVEIS